ncbi:phosphotransferase [Mycobacterium sp. CVI_P3]|uniref:Phosphotransferase n=1 Tax=Mycobacterium pinniadriaticum TaxID=2994102 RepID=A0ABT3SA56_9MYCO|nr:phosphotransferase [Mycobacterium pinniadriaticum]MCX2929961.1 phosphotransferase [Mycobacterium pinniadriaticum]MCX2936390.1 phosphotransferase [Mycobacterium pinniadriaticum]
MSNAASSVTAKGRNGNPIPSIVDSVDRMTLDWFRAVLGDAGLLADADLAAVDVEPVEGGIIARMVRARLTYTGPTEAPESVVVKFPSDDPGSRGLAVAMGMYELETLFYRDIAPLIPGLGVAKCYSARLSENAETFNLVLEDLGAEMRAGNVLETATLSECSTALGELVKFQAPLWNNAALARLDWLADPRRTIGVFDSLPAGLEPFLNRFGDHLDPSHVSLFESVVPRAGEWVRSWKAPTVVQHGDFRSDNLMFATDPQSDRTAVVDFQTVRLGPPGLDPAYYLGSSLPTAERRAAERELIAEYHERLTFSGVEGYDFDSCWAAYREGAMYGVLLFVGMASQVESSEQADRIIVDQIRRYADMALDLDAPQAAGLV